MPQSSVFSFADLLQQLRAEARLTQEELAEAAGLGVNTVGDLERGVSRTARKDTAKLLADALGLSGDTHTLFVQAARGRAEPAEVVAASSGTTAGGSPPPSLSMRYSLPPDAAVFTGRDGELDGIMAAVTDAAGIGDVGVVHAINGMPGVGKTALAVHAAHLLRGRFSDRQLFIDLHGHTPGRAPVSAEAALAELLTAIGVEARSLPEGLNGRASLWRDRMAGQQAVLVLDNAESSSQVTPLIPGGEGCRVLVTSRRHLGDLPGAIAPVMLEVLPADRAQEMFLRLAPRAEPGPAVAELLRLTGYLPLAISLLARLYARHPSWTMADLISETRASMLDLAAENISVAAAFEMSYRYLTADQQQFLRHLCMHPGVTIDAYAAAALAGIDLAGAGKHLDALHREAILIEVSYRRYGLHDLVRRYAQDRAATDPDAHREQALERLLGFYQQAATIVETRLARQAHTTVIPDPFTPQPRLPDLSDSARALAWARAERANLLACLDYAAAKGEHVRVVDLTAAMAALLRHDGPWADAIARHDAAVRAAQQCGNRPGQAHALVNLGIVRRVSGDYLGAAQAQEEALRLYRELGDRHGEANALCERGTIFRMTGQCQEAVEAQEEALRLYRELSDRHGQANALNELGAVRWMIGPYTTGIQAQEEALRLYRQLDDRHGQANALNYLGSLRQLAGDYEGAARAHEEALSISRELGHRHGQASALNYLGAMRQSAGDYPGATQALEEALAISRELGHRHGQANALNELGIVRRLTQDYAGAADAFAEALDLYRGLGDQGGEAMVLNELGILHMVRGDLDQAGDYHRRSLSLARAIDSAWDEAHALTGLGRWALAAGRPAEARAHLRQAVEIFRRIGAAEATSVAVELESLG